MKKKQYEAILFWNIKAWQLALAVFCFLLLTFFYWLILKVNTHGTSGYLNQTIINFVTKGIILLPFYWLVFIKLKQLSILKKIVLQLILLPAYVFTWIPVYHTVCDIFEIEYMTGNGIWWDVLYTGFIYLFIIGIFQTYEYYLLVKKEQVRNFELQKAGLKSELQLLKSQLNPHFLYNIFNTINASIPPENEHTRVLIARLSDLFRYQLQSTQSDLIPLRNELEFIEKYLSLEKERFRERLTYSIECKKELYELLIPPMLLQPLVENAVKHGISPNLDGGEITINIAGDNNKIEVDICDNGAGNTGENLLSKGIGLSNTNLRLEKLFGKGLQIINTGKGFHIHFSIQPVQIKL